MRPEIKKKHAEYEARRKAAEAKIHRAVDAVLRNENGRIVFMYLHNICGFAKSGIALRQGTFDEKGTAYNEVRRGVYIRLRQKATSALLAPVEEEAERQDLAPVEEDTKKGE